MESVDWMAISTNYMHKKMKMKMKIPRQFKYSVVNIASTLVALFLSKQVLLFLLLGT